MHCGKLVQPIGTNLENTNPITGVQMKLKPSGTILVTMAFVAAGVISATYTTVQAINYSGFWDARSKITVSVSRLHVETSRTTRAVTIQATVSAANPTGYSGMMVRYFELRLYFNKPALNQTLFSGGPTGDLIDAVTASNPPVGNPLGPRSNVTLILAIQLSSSQSAALQSFEQPNPSQVVGQTSVIATVDSFVDRSIGPQVVLGYETLPLS